MANKANYKPQHATIEFQDMMDQIGVESKLVNNDHLFKQVFESAFDGIVIIDQHGAIKEVNPSFCKMHGFLRENLLGQFLNQFILSDYHPLFIE